MKNQIDNVSVEILFNGKPAKQYTSEGEIFIEAKEDSEYEISIKNSNSFRIECVVGVDGINVISGDTNTEQSTGYVIDKYDTLKLKGYRVSDEKVAAFKFTKKGESYASSKSVNAQNGVINVRCYKEKIEIPKTFQLWEEPLDVIIKRKRRYIYEYDVYPYWPAPYWNQPYSTWCGTTPNTNSTGIAAFNMSNTNCSTEGKLPNTVNQCSFQAQTVPDSQNYSQELTPSDHFDMGSSFGTAKESKITHVKFERGDLLGEINLYYASRNNLKEKLGINLSNEQKVVFPQGVSKYCSPPAGWKG
jgi:hypothetical protein